MILKGQFSYPIVLTRDVDRGKDMVSWKLRGTEHIGVLITKESAWVKPLGMYILPLGDENAVRRHYDKIHRLY